MPLTVLETAAAGMDGMCGEAVAVELGGSIRAPGHEADGAFRGMLDRPAHAQAQRLRNRVGRHHAANVALHVVVKVLGHHLPSDGSYHGCTQHGLHMVHAQAHVLQRNAHVVQHQHRFPLRGAEENGSVCSVGRWKRGVNVRQPGRQTAPSVQQQCVRRLRV